jgi:hypothetical protein
MKIEQFALIPRREDVFSKKTDKEWEFFPAWHCLNCGWSFSDADKNGIF